MEEMEEAFDFVSKGYEFGGEVTRIYLSLVRKLVTKSIFECGILDLCEVRCSHVDSMCKAHILYDPSRSNA